jgi:hypothetical protein
MILEYSLDSLIWQISGLTSYAEMSPTAQHRIEFVRGYRLEHPFHPSTDKATNYTWNIAVHQTATDLLNSFDNVQTHRYEHEQ